jgi:hypothetical protein
MVLAPILVGRSLPWLSRPCQSVLPSRDETKAVCSCFLFRNCDRAVMETDFCWRLIRRFSSINSWFLKTLGKTLDLWWAFEHLCCGRLP